MTLTVRDISKLNSLKKIELVGGERGLDREVSWVYIAECFEDQLEGVSWLQGKEIVIITGRGIKGDNNLLLQLIQGIHDKNACALIINIGKYINKISEEAIKLADKLGLPLFQLPWDVKLVEVSQEICKKIILSYFEEKSFSKFFSNILFGKENLGENEVEKAAYFGYDLYGKCNISEIYIDNFDLFLHEKNIRSDEEKRRIRNKILKIVNDEFELYHYHVPILETGDSIIVFNKYDEGKLEKFNLILKTIQSKVINIIPSLTVSIGCGNYYQDINMLKKSLKEAEWALEYGIYKKVTSQIINYKDIGIYSLLFNINDKAVLEEYYFSILAPILEYDNVNDGELITTLEVYLQENCNVTLTSERLFLHRNTLKYRLRKIEDLLNCNIHDFKQCVKIQVALFIKHFIK